jgi:tRNA modification GTPase
MLESVDARTTIFALATPAGPADRAIVRISGPRAHELMAGLAPEPLGGRMAIAQGPFAGAPLASAREGDPRSVLEAPPRGAYRGRFEDGEGGQPCLALWMPGPRSYTGEDVLELHLSGSPPLVAGVLRRLLALGLSPAGPGEFTRRAFEAGRLDLARAEGVLALVSAASEAERQAAAALYTGGVGAGADRLREALEELAARLEASLDFEEDDAGHVEWSEFEGLFDAAEAELEWAVRAARARAEADPPRVGLVGLPNAGKSRLFNRLLGSERALVADLYGTTTDALWGDLEIEGLSLRLFDLPGFESAAVPSGEDSNAPPASALDEPETSVAARDWSSAAGSAIPRGAAPDAQAWNDPALSAEAQRRAADQRRSLALELLVVDARGPWPSSAPPPACPRLLLWNQIDRPGAAPWPPAECIERLRPSAVLAISAATGAGIEALRAALRQQLAAALPGESSAAGLWLVQERGLEDLSAALERARSGLQQALPLDLVAEDLRAALTALGAVRGRTLPEDLLDRIFARFCLGK